MPSIEKISNVTSIQRAISVKFIKSTGGFAVRVIPNRKGPTKEWNPVANTKQRSDLLLETLAESNDNIGIHLWGQIVDIDTDVDDPIIREALDRFLPACGHVWGRKGRPRSHRVYTLKAADAFDPSEHPLLNRIRKITESNVEVRGGPKSRGRYSIMPGSVHPSGEAYEWADISAAQSGSSVASLNDILTGVRMAGAVAVLVPHWTEGARNELTLALAGFLYRAYSITSGISEEAFTLERDQAKKFIKVLLDIAGDDPADRNARLKSFDQTWDKGENGAAIRGATTIEEITGDRDIVAKLYILLSDSPDIAALEAFTERFAIWQGPGMAVDMEGIKKGVQRPFMTRFQFLNSYGHESISYGNKKKLLADILFGLKSTIRVVGLTFEPGKASLVEGPAGKEINQWVGFEIPPAEDIVEDEDIRPFINYVWEVLADETKEHFNWIMGWIAHIFQEPANKTGTALVFVGIPGAGKSFVGHSIIAPIIGKTHTAVTNDVALITKDFNIAFNNKLFIQGDEATNNRQRAVAARMRALITDPEKMVEPKGVDAYSTPNHSRFLFTSNSEEDAIFLDGGMDDRRYTIFKVSSRYKGKIKEYWLPFVDWCQNEDNLAKVHRWLLDYKYERHFIAAPMVTEIKIHMQQRSWEPFDAWLAQWVSRNHLLSETTHDRWHDAPLGDSQIIDRTDWPDRINMTALIRDYNSFCRLINARNIDNLNERQLAQALTKRGLRPDVALTMIRVTEWEPRKEAKVSKRIRLYPAPPRDLVEGYLHRKYGVEAESSEGDEIVATNKENEHDDF